MSQDNRVRGSKIGLIAVLIKAGPKLLSVLIKLGKTLKFGKVALAGATFGGYALLLSWQFALLLMVSLFFHETGHIWAMRRCGLKTKGIYFIPFLGAAAVTEDRFPSRKAEAFIALMGPIWGWLLALAVYGAYLATGNPLWAALAGWMAMLNLFNLLPINPLDGGRLMKSVAYSISSKLGLFFLVIGLVGAFKLCLAFNLGLLVILLPIGALELLEELKNIRRDRDRRSIIAALAAKLGTEATAEATAAAVTAAIPVRLTDPDKICSAWRTESDIERTALDARIPYRTLFRRQERHAVAEHELRCDPAPEGDCALAGFLKQKSMPPMTPAGTAAAFAGYLALGAALAWLMFTASHVPAADAALQIFKG